MKVIGINPFDKCVQTFDVPVEAAELIPNHLMCVACWLNGTYALYAVEQPIVQQSFASREGTTVADDYEETWPLVALREIEKLPRYAV